MLRLICGPSGSGKTAWITQMIQKDIQAGITSPNPLVRMFAILDRRLGKRTLIKIKEEINTQPQWLQELYILRLKAELKALLR